MRLLTRLKWLHAFEATARHGSFTGAAEELGVTPAAVGQLVRALEEWVGHPLLHRVRSGKERLILVNEARSALQDISLGLDYLESGLNKLHTKKIRPILAVTVSKVLLVNWLMDKLKQFYVHYPDINLQLNILEQKLDTPRADADVSIRFGSGDWPSLNKTWLSDEEVWLVCSPIIMSQNDNNIKEWFAGQTLLEDESLEIEASFPSWIDIIQTLSIPIKRLKRRSFKSTSEIIQAVLSGQGVAMVRSLLVRNFVSNGQLVQLHTDHCWPLTWSYYCVTRGENGFRPEIELFQSWIAKEIANITSNSILDSSVIKNLTELTIR